MYNPASFLLALSIAKRELRHGLKRFGVFLACLYLGVTAVSGVGSLSQSVEEGLARDAKALLGGDVEISLIHRPLHEEQLEYIREKATRISRILTMRVMARPLKEGLPSLVELKGIDDTYPLFGEVVISPDGKVHQLLEKQKNMYGAVAEETLLIKLGLKVGDRVRVGQLEYEIRGVLKKEPDRTAQAFTLGPRLMVHSASLAESGLLKPGSLVHYKYRMALPPQRSPEGFIQDIDSRFPEAGWRTQSFSQAAPRIQRFLNRMTLDFTLVGITALLLGGLGVAGGVRGYLQTKMEHIAAMKCVGGSRKMVFHIYFIQITLLALVGTGAGIFSGAMVPFLLTMVWHNSLPFPIQLGIYGIPLFLSAAYGLLVAWIFSLYWLGKAGRVSPAVLFRGYRETGKKSPGFRILLVMIIMIVCLAALILFASEDVKLTGWFMGGVLLAFLLFRLLALGITWLMHRIPKPNIPSIRLAMAGFVRPGSPAPGMIFTLGLGLTALVVVTVVEANLQNLVSESIPEEAPAYFFIDVLPHQEKNFRSFLADHPDVMKYEGMPTIRGRITRINGMPVEKVEIDPEVRWAVRNDRALTYAEKPPEETVITKGKWWSPGYDGPPLISLTRDIAEGFHVSLGDTLTVNVLGREIQGTITNLRDADWMSLALQYAIIFSPGVLENIPTTTIATAYVKEGKENNVYRDLTGSFPEITVIRIKEVLDSIASLIGKIGKAFMAISGLTLVVGFLVLAGAVSADQRQRLMDAVIYKVCGATTGQIMAAYATEFIVSGLCAAVVSGLAGITGGFLLVREVFEMDFVFTPWIVAATLAAGLLLSLFLGLLGTRKILRQRPAPFLRNE